MRCCILFGGGGGRSGGRTLFFRPPAILSSSRRFLTLLEAFSFLQDTRMFELLLLFKGRDSRRRRQYTPLLSNFPPPSHFKLLMVNIYYLNFIKCTSS